MPVTFEEEKAISFGNVAESYDRVRPGPAPAALDWLVPDGCRVAVDLAAGTGLFTRDLLGRAGRVVAVEPDARMREVLARRSPDVDVREGRGEAMPLPDASADAVFVSTAWHWLDPGRAVPEIARVLRPRRSRFRRPGDGVVRVQPDGLDRRRARVAGVQQRLHHRLGRRPGGRPGPLTRSARAPGQGLVGHRDADAVVVLAGPALVIVAHSRCAFATVRSQ
jgi:SAM-dependent methyltransferase